MDKNPTLTTDHFYEDPQFQENLMKFFNPSGKTGTELKEHTDTLFSVNQPAGISRVQNPNYAGVDQTHLPLGDWSIPATT